jgi:hypothetical protein
LGPREWIDTFLTRTFSHRTGWISHMGERTMRTPSTSTLRHRYGWIMFGRRWWPAPNTRSSTGTPSAAIRCNAAQSPASCGMPGFQPKAGVPTHHHQCSGPAPPSSVPAPVTAMFSWPWA